MGTGWNPEPGHIKLMSLYLPTYLSGQSMDMFMAIFQLIWPHVHLGRDRWPSTHTQDLQKCLEPQRCREVKADLSLVQKNKSMPEAGHSRQKYAGFILSIVQFSSKSDIDKVKCTRKSIFTSYFLSCVQSHTFRRLSLGEWPRRESASLLLNSKREKQSYKTYASKGNITECL